MTIFSKIAAKNIATDMIVQNVAAGGQAEISFTVVRDDLPATLKAVEEATRAVGAQGYNYDDNVAKISVVGLGMKTQPGVAQKMFRALAAKGINILMITTSEIKISVLVDRESALEALRTVHATFHLDKEPSAAAGNGAGAARPLGNNTADIVARMQGMEDLIIEDITLDESQSRVTLVAVPDRPGLAAGVFEEVAAGGIVVDMIVQSVGREEQANLSFTVPDKDLDKSLSLAGSLARRLGCQPPTSCPNVAKLSVSGTGMRSHTGMARRIFQCLATAGINVEMINTSEVRLNVVIDRAQGRKALDLLKAEFADVIV
jgi:aspartate kinase